MKPGDVDHIIWHLLYIMGPKKSTGVERGKLNAFIIYLTTSSYRPTYSHTLKSFKSEMVAMAPRQTASSYGFGRNLSQRAGLSQEVFSICSVMGGCMFLSVRLLNFRLSLVQRKKHCGGFGRSIH